MTSQDEENTINSNTLPGCALQVQADLSMNDSGTCTNIDTPLTQPCSGFDLARDLHRKVATLPQRARPFAYNLIEMFEGGILASPPLGDHPLQRPEVLVRRQMERLERAIKAPADI